MTETRKCAGCHVMVWASDPDLCEMCDLHSGPNAEPETIIFDSGQRAVITHDPYQIAYECPRCHTFSEDAWPNSHFNGENWVRMYYCGMCIEASI